MLQILIIFLLGTSEKDVVAHYGVPVTISRLTYSPSVKLSLEQRRIIDCSKKEKSDILVLQYSDCTLWLNDAPDINSRKVIAVY